jgi:type IV pilus assembly protein PilY1
MIADRVYAGDLLGNVWSFDISDSLAGNWALSHGVATPLFTATNDTAGVQPITVPIAVQVHPSGAIAGYLLHFGTGKFISSTDNDETGQETQSVYAIWDYGSAGIVRGDLWKHEILAEVTHAGTGAELRITSDNTVPSTRNAAPFSWLSSGQVGDAGWESNVDRKGWRMDLINIEGGNIDNHGERLVSPVVYHGNSVIYSTLLPAGDPCEGGGTGWLMTLDAATGGRFSQTPFDINGDGTFNSSDFAAWGGGTGTAASGVKSSAGIPSVPLIINSVGGRAVVISDHSTGKLADDDGSGGPQATFPLGGGLVNGSTSVGRKSWIELD